MNIEELKDVIHMNKLAISWLDEYKTHDLGKYSTNIKKQYTEMIILKAKTNKILEKQAGSLAKSGGNPDSIYEEIIVLAKTSPTFANCFGAVTHDVSNNPVSKETAQLAIKLKKMSASWFGLIAEKGASSEQESLIATIYDQAKKVMGAPKTSDGDTVTIDFYGSKSKRCRKMRRTMEHIQDEYSGLVNVVMHLMEDEGDKMHELKLKSLPSMIFSRGNNKIATHEGSLSISATESKVNTIVDGANITNSSSVKSIKGMKAINKKELYSMGEYLLFYFEVHDCDICNEMTEDVKKKAPSYSKVKFEAVQVDGTHSIHKSFNLTQVPALVFVRKGKVIGKQIGYIQPTTLDELLDKFAESNANAIGNKVYKRFSIIPGEEEAHKEKEKKEAKAKAKAKAKK